MMMEQSLIGSPPTGNTNGCAGVHAGSFVPNYGFHPRHNKHRDQLVGVQQQFWESKHSQEKQWELLQDERLHDK